MNEMMKLHEKGGGEDSEVENVGCMKLGKLENPEKTHKKVISHHNNCPPGDTWTRTQDPSAPEYKLKNPSGDSGV